MSADAIHSITPCPAEPTPPEEREWPDGSRLRLIPVGEFVMGSTFPQLEAAKRWDRDGPLFALSHEAPQFRAGIPAFYLAIYPVTNAQFARFLSEVEPSPSSLDCWVAADEHLVPPPSAGAPWSVDPGYENHPVAHISWFGAEAYCRWAHLRLPTEMEWEKAARGTDGRIFPWGDAWDESRLRWYGGDRGENDTTAPVDAYPEGRSPYGIFQMAGNVDEWCADPYRPEIYSHYSRGDLRPPVSGYGRVLRGGTCLRRNRLEFRCAMRRGNPPALVNVLFTGFRCACDAEAVAARAPGQADEFTRRNQQGLLTVGRYRPTCGRVPRCLFKGQRGYRPPSLAAACRPEN